MEDKKIVIEALDKLGLALADHGHEWTAEERDLYERSVSLLLPCGGNALIH